MLLHRNEPSYQPTMSFKSNETFVKENRHLVRELSNAFTQIAFNPNVVLPLEFVFKSTGKCTSKISPPKSSQIPLDTKRLLSFRTTS